MNNNKNLLHFESETAGRLLFRLTWPVILSLLAQGLYNFVDSIFLSNFGEEVLSAISLASIVQNIVAALFTGIATGMNAIISKALGETDNQCAKHAVFNGCIVQGLLALLLSILSVWFVPIYFLESSSDLNVIQYGVDYLRPCMLFSVVVASQITLESLLQSTGQTRLILVCQLVGVTVNLGLDPILIFGTKSVPALGVSGAAYATMAGQLSAAVTGYILNVKNNSILMKKMFHENRFSWQMVRKVLCIGLPVSFLFVASNICNYIINRVLINFAPTANSAFGLYMKVEQMALIPHKGFQSGMLTSIAYFYGKRDMIRIRSLLIRGTQFIAGWSIICGLVFLFLPQFVLAPFNSTENMLRIGIPAVQIVGSTFLLSGFASAMGAFFQAIGKSSVFLIVTLSRQIFVRIPIALALSKTGIISAIWWSWPVSEVLSDIVSVFFFVHFYRNIKSEIALHLLNGNRSMSGPQAIRSSEQ